MAYNKELEKFENPESFFAQDFAEGSPELHNRNLAYGNIVYANLLIQKVFFILIYSWLIM